MSSPSWLEVGAPTLERPFGIKLWPIFSFFFTKIVGYEPEKFRFTPGQTPMASAYQTFGALIAYYIIILGGREIMRERQPLKLNGLFKIHNFYLTVISGGLLALFIEQLLSTLVRKGTFYAICDINGGWTDKLVVLYYVCIRSAMESEVWQELTGYS
jgi:fatty acid elongase 3